MIIVTRKDITAEDRRRIEKRLTDLGFKLHPIVGVERIVIGAVGDRRLIDIHSLESLPGVEQVIPILHPYKLASREGKPGGTRIRVGPHELGGPALIVMAGPCAVESREQLLRAAGGIAGAGGHILRGGAFKPRTSPYSFQGLQEEGLAILAEARAATGLPVITEVLNLPELETVAGTADILQIGARNMQNFGLLRAVGQLRRPVLLKRGLSATVEEWLMSAEYILAEGNEQVVLCERGIRTFETATRNTLDLAAVALAKSLTHLPVVVDPSHGTGKRSLVLPMAKAAVMAGADGLLIEVHPNPAEALSDGEQSLDLDEFALFMRELAPVAALAGKSL
ncbi:MAG: 3-deoxy-7-phosphoheptulonate synthase [Patescibacteria group bacterium]